MMKKVLRSKNNLTILHKIEKSLNK